MESRVTLNHLHDLVLLYMGLARADDELDPDETQEIALKLRQWQPNKDPALIDHVIREAELTYENDLDDDRLEEATSNLGEAFPEKLRRDILKDMADIARADNTVEFAETHFIHRIADIWELSVDDLQPSTPS